MAAPVLSPTGIRTDLVARLVGRTPAEERVFDSRAIDLESDELPAVAVYSTGGREERRAGRAPLYRRTEQLEIWAAVGAVADAEDADAAIADAVDAMEQALLAGLLEDPEWVSAFEAVERFEIAKVHDLESDKRLGAVTVQVEVTYHVQYTPTLTGFGELAKVAVTTDSIEPAGADVSERVIEVPTTPAT